ncbi:DL-endopeptidase inhibitor IseA family protein [Paenibacillus segetis]|uniref:Lipoprotein n=1 Tax=Paenibacillus segetis TaxID=1325360 RepID=A0ABQ1YS19_9BACL|nr:hypothetical protein [Paenibacillus segetis]GGH36639.1 hypothetical protein GCM10008013_43640 [Paenibacillus segetis]
MKILKRLIILLGIVCVLLTACKDKQVVSSLVVPENSPTTQTELDDAELQRTQITEADVLSIRKKADQVENDVFVSSDTWLCNENDEGQIAIPHTDTQFDIYYMCEKFNTKDKIMNYLTAALTVRNAQEQISSRMDSGLFAVINGATGIAPWEGVDGRDWDTAKVIDFNVGDQSADVVIQVFDAAFDSYDTYDGHYIYEDGWKEDSFNIRTIDEGTQNEQTSSDDVNNSELVSIDTLKGTVKVPRGLLSFINDLDEDQEDNLIQILSKDMDQDGNVEYVVSYGPDKELFDKSYVIRDVQSNYKLLKPELESGGYYIYDISLVNLEGSGQSYIYIGITNGASLEGAGVYSISNNEVINLYYGASATGSGEDLLEDDDKDGVFDKAVAYRHFSRFEMISTSNWNGKTFDKPVDSFKNSETGFVYPKSSEDLIETYVEAVYLGAEKEMNQMTSPEMTSEFDVLSVFKNTSEFHYFMAFDDVEYKVIKADKNTQIMNMTKGDETVQFTLNFDSKEQRWKIASKAGVSQQGD